MDAGRLQALNRLLGDGRSLRRIESDHGALVEGLLAQGGGCVVGCCSGGVGQGALAHEGDGVIDGERAEDDEDQHGSGHEDEDAPTLLWRRWKPFAGHRHGVSVGDSIEGTPLR